MHILSLDIVTELYIFSNKISNIPRISFEGALFGIQAMYLHFLNYFPSLHEIYRR